MVLTKGGGLGSVRSSGNLYGFNHRRRVRLSEISQEISMEISMVLTKGGGLGSVRSPGNLYGFNQRRRVRLSEISRKSLWL